MTTNNTHGIRPAAGRALGILAVLIAGLGISVVAQAQAQAQEDPVMDQAKEEGGAQTQKKLATEKKEDQVAGIQEVVVTTRRLEEKLKEVPLSITAFNSKMIESAGITNLADVAALTPGLSFFNPLGENLPVPIIRGIVPQDIFGENAAAVFIDGVYVAGREGLNFSQLDIERIEVVKGPQSAMYGRNAFSGAINYVTKKPTNEFEAKTTVNYGNRGKEEVQASVSGPIWGDTLFGRVAGLYDDWDGSYNNSIAGGGNDIGGHRFRSFQGALRWVPDDALEVNSSLYYSNDRIDDSAVAAIAANCENQVETTTAHATNEPYPRLQNFCGRVPNLDALPDALDPNTFPNPTTIPGSVTRDSMPKVSQSTGENRELKRASVNVDWDVGFGTFGFLTGYSDLQQSDTSDFGRSTGNAIPFLYCPGAQTVQAPASCPQDTTFVRIPMGFIDKENGSTVTEFSQEARFTSPTDKRLRATGGVYYFHDLLNSYPGGLIATTQLPGNSPNGIGLGAVPGGTQLAIGSYIFGQSIQPDGTIDPMNRVEGRDRTESWSLFSAVDYDLTEAWQARAEARYTQQSETSLLNTYNNLCVNPGYYQPDPNSPPGTIPVPVTSDPYNPQNFPYNLPPAADCGNAYWDLRTPTVGWNLDKDANGNLIVGTREPGTTTQTGSGRFSTLTGRLSLKYQFESGWMAYSSIAFGEKPGGIQLLQGTVVNTVTGFTPTESFSNQFDPEKITAYELGIKGFTSDRRIGIDMAMFYNDWTNIVLRQLQETAPSGLTFTQPVGVNINSGDARVWGWEATTDFAFTDNLSGRLTASWTDSQLTNARQDTYSLFPSFYTKEPSCAPAAIQAITDPDPDNGPTVEQLQNTKAAQCQQLSGDVSGNTALRQPEWTASASLDYRHQLRGNWNWYAHGDGNYTDKIYVGNDNQSYLPARTIANLRLGVESERYTVEFWVRNLFDNDYPIAAFRDIYWTNTSDITASHAPAHSNFDDFPPLRYSVSYPSLRTFGVLARVRFGAAVK